MSRKQGDLFYDPLIFLEAVPLTPDFKTTEAIQKEVGEKLKKNISWGTAHKYLTMLQRQEKVILKQISRYNNWTRTR